jgi:cyclopropane fatty-acyl-phospholipid synthase-like methyltransferase
MTEDRTMMLFFEMFSGLPRQGPGDTTSTLKALAMVPGVDANTLVLDIGCGTGAQTRVLAQHSPARLVAIDCFQPYIDELSRYADAHSLADRLEARGGDMRQLDLPVRSFDLIWCEGAISIMGFEAGLRTWRELLKPGGYMAVTEVCWAKPDPPPECGAFWAEEYPAIRDLRTLLDTIDQCGYHTVGHFALPRSAWWDEYYRPLEPNIAAFRERHRSEADAQDLADRVEREIDVWRKYSDFYQYEFFVMRAP